MPQQFEGYLRFEEYLGNPYIPMLAFRSEPYDGEYKYFWRFDDLWLMLQTDNPIHWSIVPMAIPQVEEMVQRLQNEGWEIVYKAPTLSIKTVMFFTEGDDDES